jgi:hypothetical protein
VYQSADGSNWSLASLNHTERLTAPKAGGGYVVSASDDGSIFDSTDFTTWNHTTGLTSEILSNVVYGNDQFVVTGFNGAVAASNKISTIPEPSTYTLFGVGGLGLLILLRRKRRNGTLLSE